MRPLFLLRPMLVVLLAFAWFAFGRDDAQGQRAHAAGVLADRFGEHPMTGEEVDHAAWGRILERYSSPGPDGVARFDYAGVSPADRGRLRGYLDRLQAVDVDALAEDERFAYWANLYNAATVNLILDQPGVENIRAIELGGGGLFGLSDKLTGEAGPWEEPLVTVEGLDLSLDDVEHGILRPVYQDPRVHYAVNCASIGCPDLRAEPWTGEGLDEDLDEAAAAYVNHPRGVSLDDGELTVSRIYDWFARDFGDGSVAAVIEHLAEHAEPGLAAELRSRDSIDGYAYDWSLNSPGAGSS